MNNLSYYEERMALLRDNLRGVFTKREMKNPITFASVVRKYHNLHWLKEYPHGIPENMIRMDLYVAKKLNQKHG